MVCAPSTPSRSATPTTTRKLALLQGERQEDNAAMSTSHPKVGCITVAEKAAAFIKAQAERQSQYNTWKQRQQGVDPVTVSVEG